MHRNRNTETSETQCFSFTVRSFSHGSFTAFLQGPVRQASRGLYMAPRGGPNFRLRRPLWRPLKLAKLPPSLAPSGHTQWHFWRALCLSS